MLYQHDLSSELTLREIFLVFFNGIRMDFSMAGYFTLLSGLILGVFFFARGKTIWPYWFGYNAVALFVSSFIVVLDFELYSHWGFRLDATPLLYISREAAGSAGIGTALLLIGYWLLIFAVVLFFMYRYFRPRFYALEATSWPSLPALVIATAALIIPIRGSFGVAPMNSGFVYFHPNNVFANHSAVNVVWNFFYAVQKMNRLKYADNYFDRNKTIQYVDAMFPAPDTTYSLLKTKRPNVIVIILESYTSTFIGALGGPPNVTPRFNALVKEGILFDHFYSSGDRTDKGIVSVLNGYPAQPVTSIIKDPKKTRTLPYLNKVFKRQGYQTAFTFGNDINFANFNSYLINGDFDHITHSLDFPQELNTGKWGVDDQYVFDRFLDELQEARPPFFSVMMTLSSHEPYNVPMKTVIEGDDDIHRFLNAAYYTDKCLGEFIDRAKESDWWKDTFIIITADHGHNYPSSPGVSNPDKFKIPMLWLGGALAARDTVIHTLACNPDIANTILGQVDLYDKDFLFSHDIMSGTYNPFAVFVFNDGFGLVKEDGLFVYDNIGKNIIRQSGAVTPTDMEQGKAYMQQLYWDFNSR